jgi:hypothetical protein
MKAVMLGLLLTTVFATDLLGNKPIEKTTSFEAVTSFSHGFVSGLGENLGVEEFVTCTQESYLAITQFYSSITHIFGSTYFDSLISLEKFGQTLVHVSRGLFECQLAYEADFTELQHLVELISDHPEVYFRNLAKKLLFDGNTLLDKLQQGMVSWEQEQFYASGKNFGAFLSMVIEN